MAKGLAFVAQKHEVGTLVSFGFIRRSKRLAESYRGPEIPCFRIIKKCISIKTAVARGNTNVCKL